MLLYQLHCDMDNFNNELLNIQPYKMNELSQLF